MNIHRIRELISGKETQNGPIILWMNRDMRIHDNWSFTYAFEKAQERGEKLLVVYNLVKENSISFTILETTEKSSGGELVSFFEKHKAGEIITDFCPLKIAKKWTEYVVKHSHCRVTQVDSHNIIPCWYLSPKQEYAAYTIRPKVFKLLSEFLDEFPKLKSTKLDYKHASQVGIYKEAAKLLDNFLTSKLDNYNTLRNDPLVDQQSNLSPYLHYGVIAPQRVALSVLEFVDKPITKLLHDKKNLAGIDHKEQEGSAGAFLEELIVRRELSDNFCYYCQDYDSTKCFPSWAIDSLDKEEKTEREYLYTKKEFEEARTHDELWNAAQTEMLVTGKMHGYLRMYWAKKILEWTKNAEEAMKIAVYLNDKYELDGRDPNGYAGIAWSIGGVHDRAWFPRRVFGLVRFMAKSGCDKKFDTKAYINKWLGGQEKLF
jgi:deoxyribodipyrimidine photo-lyase